MDKETKICKECGRELPISQFNKNVAMKSGYVNICKDCLRTQRQKRRGQVVIEAKTEGTMICPVCGKELPVTFFNVYARSKTGRD